MLNRGKIMNISITSRNVTPSEELTHLIKQKLANLLKYDSNIIHSKVTLLKESRAEKVELIVKDKNDTYISKCFSSRFEKTIAKAVDNILVQIKKRTKRYHRVSSKSDINDYLDK